MLFRRHHKRRLGRLDDLIARLPFPLDDGRAAGDLYAEWLARPTEDRRYLVDLWTYCYVRRYFLVKFLRSGVRHTPADLDMVVERAFRKIEENRASILDGRRYPRWVAVVCRNTFLNYAGRTPEHVSMDRVAEPAGPVTLEEALDMAARASALDLAISRLPAYVREPTRMRVVAGLSYEVISERLGIAVPSVRTYVHRGLRRLRADRAFLRAMGYENRHIVSEET